MTFRECVAIGGCVLALSSVRPVNAQTVSPWHRLQFLLGTWDATGANQLGSGEGSASFTLELNGHVIVRRSFADYSAGPQAGTRHDDLLVIYEGAGDAAPRAIYFDSEGHVIRYTIATSTENTVRFQSEALDPGPKYRLTYTREADILNGTFEIAVSGGEFKTYLSWSTVRR
jgi:hypothetical protein